MDKQKKEKTQTYFFGFFSPPKVKHAPKMPVMSRSKHSTLHLWVNGFHLLDNKQTLHYGNSWTSSDCKNVAKLVLFNSNLEMF
jgi:hypothetical protein